MPKFSQNFLIDHTVLPKIVEAASLNCQDLVLEIGPGRGILTDILCQNTKEVIAIEIDPELIPNLKDMETKHSNLKIFHADFNTFNYQQIIAGRPYKIVANIPYHITGLIIRNIFNPSFHLPQKVVLMVQWEVATKMIPKTNDQTVLSNLLRMFGDVSIVQKVPKASFRPIPKVDSAIILVNNIQKPDINNLEKFIKFIKIGFAARRKTLLNNLSAGLDFPKTEMIKVLSCSDIDPARRAQTLTQSEWKKLYLNLKLQNN